MPATYRIDAKRHVVFSVASGDLTEEDTRAHTRSLAGDPEFDPAFDQLLDFRDADTFGLSAEYMRANANENPSAHIVVALTTALN